MAKSRQILTRFSAHFIRQRELGRGFGAETGFLLKRNPDTVARPILRSSPSDNFPKIEPNEAILAGRAGLGGRSSVAGRYNGRSR